MNPFPEKRIREFLADAGDSRRFLFSLFSAHRAVVLAEGSIDGFSAEDQLVIYPALDSCWRSTSTNDFEALAGHASSLLERLVDEDDDTYDFYNGVTNDAIASLVFGIECATSGDRDSAYYAAQRLFDLADLLLHRSRSEYVSDLAAAPITAYAATCLSADLDHLSGPNAGVNLARRRAQLTDEGHELGRLAV